MTRDVDDAELMLRYRAGDVSAFETVYRRHKDGLYRYFLRHTNNAAAADDLYQEAWTKIIAARHRYQASAKFTTYLYRVANNCFIDYLRKQKPGDVPAVTDPDVIESAAPEPAHQVDRASAKSRLQSALSALPAEQRDAFLLFAEAGLSLETIATVCGTTRETIKSRLRYARGKLRESLADLHGTVVAIDEEPS